ncbi:secreted RxLR effector protein 161-like [Nicotiana sylvestris]|uniref:secreted RxLR effector protein 161-like n=1 Tax=Nicotiana sylvestris TaxID=4096 RepID=UPI00388CE0D5
MKYMSKVPYASVVGSLMYAMICTRPDIAHVVGVVSRYMSDPGKDHWEGFAGANLGGDLDSQKSTTGYVFTLGGTVVSWMTRLQKSVAPSTIEAE